MLSKRNVYTKAVATPARTTSEERPCSDEEIACDDDAECNECFAGWSAVDGGSAASTECLENQDYDDSCSGASAGPCCYESLFANDCLGNIAFEEYMVYIINESSTAVRECTTVTCNGGDDGTSVSENGDDGTPSGDDDDSGVGSSSPVWEALPLVPYSKVF